MDSLKFLQTNLDHTRAATPHLVDFVEAEHIDVAVVCDPYASGSTVLGVPPNWLRFLHQDTPRCMVLIPRRKFDVFPLTVSPYIVALRLQNQQSTMLLIATYAAPSVPMDFILSRINDVLERYCATNVILAGDFNARNPIWGGDVLNSRGAQLAHFIHSTRLKILNDPNSVATFQNAYSESWIDLTLVSGPIWEGDCLWNVHDTPTLSDHKYVVFGLQRFPLPLKRRLTKASLQYLVEELAADDWIQNFNPQDVCTKSALNTVLDVFYSKLARLKNKFERPLKEHRGNAWWSDALARERSAVRVLRRRYQKCRDPLLRANHRIVYYRSLAAYREHIQIAKDKALRQACADASRKSLFGQPFKAAFRKHRVPSVLSPLHLPDDTSTTSTLESAGLLLKTHFPSDCHEDDTLAHKAMRVVIATTRYHAEVHDELFTLDELRLASRKLNLGSAPGPDNITTPMVHLLVHHISSFLLHVFNSCLLLGYFPPHWKQAHVKFLLKPGRPPTEPSSYRTICITSMIGKLLERMLNSRFYYFLHRSGLLHPHQYGFTLGHNTTTALFDLRSRLQHHRDHGGLSLVISLDFAGAFDTIWHPRLLYFFRTHNCPRNIYELLKSFLEGRTVRYEAFSGNITHFTTKGSPQGSPISPLLWNAYIFDMLCIPMPEDTYLQAYADDTVIVIHARTRRQLEATAHETLSKITTWAEKAKLRLNPSKCSCLLVSRGDRGAIRKPTIRLLGVTLKQVTEMKLLGVVFDNHLTFVAHTNHLKSIVEKMAGSLTRFARMHTLVNRSHLRQLHHLVVLPAISYAAPAWWHLNQHHSLKARVHSLLRSSLFAITGAYTTTRTAALEVIANALPLHIHLDIAVRIFLLFHHRQSITFHSVSFRPADVDLPIGLATHPARRLRVRSGRLTSAEANQRLHLSALHAFTDGSHTPTAAGAAFVILNGPDRVHAVRRFRLVSPTTSFDAEVIALQKLIEFLLDNRPSSPVNIYSDSLSVLLALNNPFNKSSTIHQLKHDILLLSSSVSLALYHVPAHSNVWGNEIADAVARSAATRGQDVCGKISKHMVRSSLLKAGRLLWQEAWSSNNSDTELFRWTPSVLNLPASFPPSKKLTHLITGHGRFPHYFFRLELTPDCLCFCGAAATSVSHYLTQCSKTSSYIQRLLRIVRPPLEPPNLRHLLDNSEAIQILIELVDFISRSLPDV